EPQLVVTELLYQGRELAHVAVGSGPVSRLHGGALQAEKSDSEAHATSAARQRHALTKPRGRDHNTPGSNKNKHSLVTAGVATAWWEEIGRAAWRGGGQERAGCGIE